MTTLNGLPRTWDSFIQGIYAKNKLVKFSILWEECSQEKSRIAAQEEKTGSEDQSLTVQSKKSRSKHHRTKYSHHRNNSRNPRDSSKYICYTCDEKGHFSRDCPKNKSSSHNKKGNKIRHHAHAVEDDEPSSKRTIYEIEDSSSKDEHVLISALMGNITHGSDDWLIDSGASKHMTEFKESFVKLSYH